MPETDPTTSGDCPTSPPKPDPIDLAFVPFQPMVKWFSPTELVRAGMKAVMSSMFGSYADNREFQAVRSHLEPVSYAAAEEIWFDYVADLGDGWDSTYAVARLLAAPKLALRTDGSDIETERGRILIMGGDQVYPTATREAYANRLVGPYRSALSCVLPESAAPHLFAIPGNHDWYDGLTSFTRLFCQGRWIGGWKTQQTRSYFALELPHGWWLWGIDVQLGSDIDHPQLTFFRELGSSMPAGSKIILCVAEPTWVYTHSKGIESYDNLALFEDKAIREFGHHHVVGLAGDLHTYARYESTDGRQRFVAGGGGAYLYPTHDLPSRLTVPTEPGPKADRKTEHFDLGHPEIPSGESLFPSRRESKRLSWGSLLFPTRNVSFSVFVGIFYLVLIWLVQTASKMLDVPFLETLTGANRDVTSSVAESAGYFLTVLSHAPLALFIVLVLGGGLVGLADGKGIRRIALGLGHTAAHLVALLILTWLFAAVNLVRLGLEVDTASQVLLFTVEMLTIGSFVGGTIMGVYLFVSNRVFGLHANEVFSSQSRPDFKQILRLHINKQGHLTIYPIGLRRVPRKWRYRPNIGGGEPWFDPDDEAGSVEGQAILIEPPVTVETATTPK